MQLSHIVIGCAFGTRCDKSHGILEGHGEVSAEPMGLQAACLDYYVCLYEDSRNLEAVLPMQSLGLDIVPVFWASRIEAIEFLSGLAIYMRSKFPPPEVIGILLKARYQPKIVLT